MVADLLETYLDGIERYCSRGVYSFPSSTRTAINFILKKLREEVKLTSNGTDTTAFHKVLADFKASVDTSDTQIASGNGSPFRHDLSNLMREVYRLQEISAGAVVKETSWSKAEAKSTGVRPITLSPSPIAGGISEVDLT